MNSTFTKEKEEYLQGKNKFIHKLKLSTGINIKEVEFIENTDVFRTLIAALGDFERFVCDSTQMDIKAQYKEFLTLVEKKKGGLLKFHNTITFFLEDGSHIRFSPHNKNGIEISRVWVNPENHRNGLGSLLMELFFDFMLFAKVEPSEYFLECTGAVGLGENKQELSVASQTNFFRKFGFRVNNRKGYPDYITMIKKGSQLN